MAVSGKMTAPDFYKKLNDSFINVELISGKWLINKKEFELYGKDGLLDTLARYDSWIEQNTNCDAFIKYIIEHKADIDGEWPELPILTEAKAKLATGYRPTELAYPLNEKELKIIHYLIDGDKKDTYAIFFHGVGGSGKSTVCNLIASLFGKNDVCRCGFTDLGRQFARETMAGKRLWYDADISPYWSDKDANVLKKIITHDYDQFEKKGKNPYVAQYRCNSLFCCNVAPKFDVSDSGLLRRIVYYSKNKKIANPNGDLANKKYTHDELVDIACEALLTDISNFYDEFIDETREIIMSSNNVAKYGMTDSYDSYCLRCQSANTRPFGLDKWESLKELFTEWKRFPLQENTPKLFF